MDPLIWCNVHFCIIHNVVGSLRVSPEINQAISDFGTSCFENVVSS